MNRKAILVTTTILLILVGALLHFVYAWSDYNPFIALISSVNESVWEHWKLGFYGTLFIMPLEIILLSQLNNFNIRNYLTGRGLGNLVLQLIITLGFYIYIQFTGKEILIIDIILFIIGVCVSSYIVNEYLKVKTVSVKKYAVVVGAIFFQFILLSLFTFYPPHIDLLLEDHSGRYGTEWNYHPEEGDHDHDH